MLEKIKIKVLSFLDKPVTMAHVLGGILGIYLVYIYAPCILSFLRACNY